MRLSARRARKFRKVIAADRCPVRPGITHRWMQDAGFDPTSFGAIIEWWQCEKCGVVQS